MVRIASLEFAHTDRLDYRRGHCKPTDQRAQRNRRRGLGPGRKVGKSLFLSPNFGFLLALYFCDHESTYKDKRLYEAPKGTEPYVMDSWNVNSDVHRRKFLPWLNDGKKAWF